MIIIGEEDRKIGYEDILKGNLGDRKTGQQEGGRTEGLEGRIIGGQGNSKVGGL